MAMSKRVKKKSSKLVFKAIKFATKAHSGQFRKGTRVPYIVHPLGVGKILIEYNCPEEVVIAGILHDTIEDTSVTIKDIGLHFGKNVERIVEGASEPNRADTWKNRKKHTIEYLKTAPNDVLLVACADKLDNIRAIKEDYEQIGNKLWTRFNRPKKDQKWYYQSLARSFIVSSKDIPNRTLSRVFAKAVSNFFK